MSQAINQSISVVQLSIYLSSYLSTCLALYPSICPSIYASVYPSIDLSIDLSACRSFYLATSTKQSVIMASSCSESLPPVFRNRDRGNRLSMKRTRASKTRGSPNTLFGSGSVWLALDLPCVDLVCGSDEEQQRPHQAKELHLQVEVGFFFLEPCTV